MITQLLLVHCLSPLHAGIGQSTGPVDLGIARDRATGFPYLPGSSIKGVLRDRASRVRAIPAPEVHAAFGPPTENASDHAGGIVFGDANLLCMPVRSVKGTFAWVTSPFLLQRFLRDASEAGLTLPAVPTAPRLGEVVVAANASNLVHDNKVYFEDLDFAVSEADARGVASALAELLFSEDTAWKDAFIGRFALVHDDAMAFLSQHATDVVTRVSLDSEKKTVKEGQLWTEESLPAESILASLVAASPTTRGSTTARLKDVLREVTTGSVQFGGHTTVGRGRSRMILAGGGAA